MYLLLQAAADTSKLWIEAAIRTNLIASAVGFAVINVVRMGAVRLINRQVEDPRLRYAWRKWVGYVCYGLYALAMVGLWLPNVEGISTFLGLFAAGVAVVLRDPLVNLVAWLFILWRQPFHMGDRIQIGEHSGDVIDIGVFQFTLMEIGNWVDTDQSTGGELSMCRMERCFRQRSPTILKALNTFGMRFRC